jgi:hypothetical protein
MSSKTAPFAVWPGRLDNDIDRAGTALKGAAQSLTDSYLYRHLADTHANEIADVARAGH